MGLFSPKSTSAPICPTEGNNATGVPIAGSLTFQHIILIAGGACTALTLALSLSLIIKHLHRYTFPDEQRQIVRMVFTPVVFAACNLLAIAFYSASVYLTPIADLYEAFALASIFALFVQFIAPDASQHENFFANTEQKSRKGETLSSESWGWFKYIWIVVFIYPVVKTILFIAQEASQATGRFCSTSNNIHFGHIWITILGAISVTLAVVAILKFYGRFKKDMAHHKPLAKLISFKLIVFTNFVQTLIFSFLNSGGHLGGNTKVTHQDLWLGIPALLICFEQVIFSALFHYSCRSQEYHPANLGSDRHGLGIFRAAADALNPSDLLVGISKAFYLLLSSFGASKRGGGNKIPLTSGRRGYNTPQAGSNNTYAQGPRLNGYQPTAPEYTQ